MNPDPVYQTFWRRKQLLAGPVPRFPIRRYWESESLCEIERIYRDAIRDSASLLDFGAGDMRVLRRLQKAGYQGECDTLDVGEEHPHTYRDLSEIHRKYGAILCLDVLEHLPLREGLTLLNKLLAILEPGGVLLLQTPNAQCIRDPLGWDMTHVHCYNITDLWAYLTALNFKVTGYRVLNEPPTRKPWALAWHIFRAFFITRVLRCDFADNIALIARKPAV